MWMALWEHIWGYLRKKLFFFHLPACLYVSLAICFTRDNAVAFTVAVIICWHQHTSSLTFQSGLRLSDFIEIFQVFNTRVRVSSFWVLSFSRVKRAIVGLPRLHHVSQSNKFLVNISYSRNPWLLVSLFTLFFLKQGFITYPKKTWIIFLLSQPPKCWECRHVSSHLAEVHF